jgi:hypothetical protein
MMNTKTNIPDEVIPGKSYRFWTDMKVNSWMMVAMVTAGMSDLLLHSNYPALLHLRENAEGWPIAIRVLIELAPVLFSLLWARKVVRWIGGMDELHRRITLEASLFAATGTLVIVTVWHRLATAGVLQAIFQTPPAPPQPLAHWDFRCLGSLDLGQFALTIAMVYLLYFVGHTLSNRRYQ